MNNVIEIIKRILLMHFTWLDIFESLCGKLNNISLLIWPGKAFIKRLLELLYSYIRRFGRKGVLVVFPNWALRDLRWWLTYLSCVRRVSILDMFEHNRPSIEIWTDGATNGARDSMNGWMPGIGAFCNGHYIMDRVPDHLIKQYIDLERKYAKDFSIVHFEMMAITSALASLDAILGTNAHLVIWCDNKGVECIMKSKSTDDLFLQASLRWILMFCVQRLHTIYVKRIDTKANKLADALSRFSFEDFMEYQASW
eukprot:43656_1